MDHNWRYFYYILSTIYYLNNYENCYKICFVINLIVSFVWWLRIYSNLFIKLSLKQIFLGFSTSLAALGMIKSLFWLCIQKIVLNHCFQSTKSKFIIVCFQCFSPKYKLKTKTVWEVTIFCSGKKKKYSYFQ